MDQYSAAVLYELPYTIGVTGRMGAGKDTFAAPFLAAGYTKLSFAHPLKVRVAEEAGITLAELELNKGKYRSRLQEIGQGERAADPLHWVKLWQKARDEINGPVIVTDVRYGNEGEWIMTHGGFLVRVSVPPGVQRNRLIALYGVVNEQQLNHSSEIEVDTMPVHLQISGEMDTVLAMPVVARGFHQLRQELAGV